jgi:hypothetical protein
MKLQLILLIIFLSLKITTAQKVDSIKLNNFAKKITNTFVDQSFPKFEILLLNTDDRVEFAKKAGFAHQITPENLDALNSSFEKVRNESKEIFNSIIKKGILKGVNWNEIVFEEFIFHTEEILSLNHEVISKGELISGHIRFNAGGNHFTIIGIELQKTADGYKLQGEQLRGLYEIDLDIYSFR